MTDPFVWVIRALVVCAVGPLMAALNEMSVVSEWVNWIVLPVFVGSIIFCLAMAVYRADQRGEV